MKVVVGALIYNDDNKFMICRRNDGNSEVIGKWEFPGGKVDPGETDEEAIVREIKEELEIDVLCNNYVTNSIYTYPNGELDLRLYKCTYLNGNIKLNNHTEYKYVDKNEVLNFDLCPADIPLAEYLSRN